MNTTSEMQLVPIDKLIPYINNARTHSPEQLNKLRSSLREFGFINPVIIDRDFNVIAGHGRILAAKAENISEVPCVFVDYLTHAQKKAFRCFLLRLGFIGSEYKAERKILLRNLTGSSAFKNGGVSNEIPE